MDVVTIPWGEWVQGLLPIAGTILLTVLSWAIAMLPGPLRAIILMTRAEQLLRRAVDYAINATDQAVAGRELEVPVANVVLRRALEYAIEQGGSLARQLGDDRALAKKIIARLPLPPEAKVIDDGRVIEIRG